MCLGMGAKVDTSYQDFQRAEAARARAEEEARQSRIATGMEGIKAIFEGGQHDSQTYEGMQPYLDQRETAMRDFYLPQLDQEVDRSTEDLTFALKRAGLLNSSMAGERQADLMQQHQLQRGSIMADIARDLSNTKGQINNNRSAIEASLRSSGDATAATNQAMQSAVTFRQDSPELNPIGNIFAGIATGLGAAKQGYDTQVIRNKATPKPLSSRGTGRQVA